MRFIALVAALLCIGVWLAFASGVQPRAPSPPVADLAMSSDVIRQRLEREVTWEKQMLFLSELPTFLANEFKVPAYIDRADLGVVGVEDQTRLTLNFTNVPAHVALHTLLRQHDLDFVIADDHIKICSVGASEQYLVERVYPVRDLVTQRTSKGEVEDYDTLIATIEESVSPESWRNLGTGEGTSTSADFAGALIIRQSPRVHDEIVRLLHKLRKVRAEQPPGPMPEEAPQKQHRPYVGSPIPVVG